MSRGVALVFAMSDARVIGKDGGLPWHIPEDMKHFRRVTLDHAVVMGRLTYQSMGEPLPRRRNIVVTRDPAVRFEGCEVVTTLDAALELAWQTDDEPRVIGGSQIYALALPRATRMYMTEIHRDVEGDVRFPEFDRSEWREVERRRAETEPDVEFVTLERVRPAP